MKENMNYMDPDMMPAPLQIRGAAGPTNLLTQDSGVQTGNQDDPHATFDLKALIDHVDELTIELRQSIVHAIDRPQPPIDMESAVAETATTLLEGAMNTDSHIRTGHYSIYEKQSNTTSGEIVEDDSFVTLNHYTEERIAGPATTAKASCHTNANARDESNKVQKRTLTYIPTSPNHFPKQYSREHQDRSDVWYNTGTATEITAITHRAPGSRFVAHHMPSGGLTVEVSGHIANMESSPDVRSQSRDVPNHEHSADPAITALVPVRVNPSWLLEDTLNSSHMELSRDWTPPKPALEIRHGSMVRGYLSDTPEENPGISAASLIHPPCQRDLTDGGHQSRRKHDM